MAQYQNTPRDYWRILGRRKGVVIFTALLLGGGSLVSVALWVPQPLFRAAARVQIRACQAWAGRGLPVGTDDRPDPLASERAIITSFPVLQRTGETLGIFLDQDTVQVILDLQRRITTFQEGRTNIVVIEAVDSQPHMARELANQVALNYREYNRERKNWQALNKRQFVEGQRHKARAALAEAEEKIRAYRAQNQAISFDAQTWDILEQLARLDQQLEQLRQLGCDWDVVLPPLPQTFRGQAGEVLTNSIDQLDSLRLERDRLLVQFAGRHPPLEQVQAGIDRLSAALAGERHRRWQGVGRQLERIRASLYRLFQEYRQPSPVEFELARLQREAMLQREVVSTLEREYQKALIREADMIEEVVVLQWAITPAEPLNPPRPLPRLGGGLILGLVLGAVVAVFAEKRDARSFQRLMAWVRRGRWGEGEEDIEAEEDESADPQVQAVLKGPRLPTHKSSRWSPLARWGLLALVGLGVVWQSGYLPRLLGLAPLLQVRYEKPEPGIGQTAGQVLQDPAVVAEVPRPFEPVDPAARALPPPRETEQFRALFVDPEKPSPALLPAAVWPERSYTIRAGAYRVNSRWGRRLFAALSERGEPVFMAPVMVDGQRLKRLLIGSFAGKDEALEYAAQLAGQGIADDFAVISLPYAVELAVAFEAAPVRRLLAALENRRRFAYVQTGVEGALRVLAGAFETAEQARDFAQELAGNRQPGQVVLR